jgi:hypothetical protein
MVSITVYDGVNGIGGNKIYVKEKLRGFSLDFGRNFDLLAMLVGKNVFIRCNGAGQTSGGGTPFSDGHSR